jgi:hypothetical protein
MSRDLDYQVAEKVMGWKWVATKPTGALTLLPPEFDRCVVIEDSFGTERVAHFSSSLAATMSVIEKMRELGREVSIGANAHNWNVGCGLTRKAVDGWPN